MEGGGGSLQQRGLGRAAVLQMAATERNERKGSGWLCTCRLCTPCDHSERGFKGPCLVLPRVYFAVHGRGLDVGGADAAAKGRVQPLAGPTEGLEGLRGRVPASFASSACFLH